MIVSFGEVITRRIQAAVLGVLAAVLIPAHVAAQEEGIFWGEEDTLFQEDTLFGEEDFFGEGDQLFEGEEGVFDEGFFDEGLEGGEALPEETDYFLGEEAAKEEQTGVALAQEAIRRGFTVQVSAASPGYVNHTLQSWNSFLDFRVAVDLPFLMQVGPVKFRLGAEVTTFRFENYLPVGGEFGGVGFLGMVTFPAGPSSVQLGAGMMGSVPAFVVAQSFGLSVANLIDVRVGVRSTTTFSVPDQLKDSGSRAAWMDGYMALGYTL